MDEQGEVTKRVSGTLSEEGCFDSLELLDLENNTVVALVLDANYYRDVAETLEKRVRLQGKCRLTELPSAGVSWETSGHGWWLKPAANKCRWNIAMMIRVIRWVKPRKVTTKHYLSAPRHQRIRSKKLDYTAVTLLNNQRVGNVKQSCEYDSHANPVDCQLSRC